MANPEVKFDLHVHSESSHDSVAEVWRIEKVRERRGLNGFAITDHDVISETNLYLHEKSEIPFILGEEILTSDKNLYGKNGKRIEIIGLFLQEPISSGLTMSETIYQIGAQGGIVVIPHPFEEWRHGAGEQGSRYIIALCLIRNVPVAIEVFNARAKANKYNRQAQWLWRELMDKGVLGTAGSDAHRIAEVGRAHVLLPPFQTKEEFLESLTQARIWGEYHGWGTLYHRLTNRIEVGIGRSFPDL